MMMHGKYRPCRRARHSDDPFRCLTMGIDESDAACPARFDRSAGLGPNLRFQMERRRREVLTSSDTMGSVLPGSGPKTDI